ncbi:sigma-70 family RNA polymerase sigma factor [Cryobacterium sp. PH31-AA6]|uniref:RNA polymerase sigma factor n=1 Tax=Cryobacterium sp. PH31-AA6 TaxID=3046205 RepID=UPI0024BBDB28|nr:sigma-70 family RNA polymerase sigma factor [Cryobacterium sp. PH31-AA6]MDJ0323042.1 sigma-70 family RNA polymerase sigma factor [Cryobacterium sp. PH31-AA6]
MQQLHEQMAAVLLGYFARRVEPQADAADLLSETLMVAWRRMNRVPSDEEGARMWMFATARRVLANWTRGQRRRTALSYELREQMATVTGVVVSDQALDVRQAVRSLPRNQRELIVLVHWDGFTIPDAARLLQVRESTARGRYQRAKTSLQAALADPPAQLRFTTAKATTP